MIFCVGFLILQGVDFFLDPESDIGGYDPLLSQFVLLQLELLRLRFRVAAGERSWVK